jgi:3',5'-cyclic AMP phosphodiesterase CpdA
LRLWAISDLHVRFPANRELVRTIAASAEDWLILAGDLGEGEDDLRFVFDTLASRFTKLVWVPGNHELWTLPADTAAPGARGESKYRRLVELCRSYGVVTPEDPYPTLIARLVLAPLFLLYDYSFVDPSVGPLSPYNAVAWAAQSGVACADEVLLHPDPYASRRAWCEQRLAITEARLKAIPPDHHTILVNHYPLRYEHVTIPAIPRFSIWCGTRRTEDWHLRFRAEAVVYGHLHVPGTRLRDGVRFEEVSLGYPRQWASTKAATNPLRLIWPPPP